MQLLSLSVYNASGARRDVRFVPGQLNVVTGASATGKSALLDMFEYCMGRDRIMMPVGPITATVTWYAALFLLPDGGRAFVARPAPQAGQASTQRAMLEFGADLELLPYSALSANIDTATLREQLGRRLGIEENLHEPPEGAARPALEANLGHATLLCLQRQDEIASRTHLFHRQGETGIEQALRDTLPYFLGAVPRDQALKRARLRDARRNQARIVAALSNAERASQIVEAQIASLLSEAYAVGLTPVGTAETRTDALRLLEEAARTKPGIDTPNQPDGDVGASTLRRHGLAQEQTRLRNALRGIARDRDLLLETGDGENGYREASELQLGRLNSLNLLPDSPGTSTVPLADVDATCPLCSSRLAEPDPAVRDMQDALEQLQRQLRGIDEAAQARRQALSDLDEQAADLREELRAVDAAIRALAEGDDQVDAVVGEERQAFTRGRISAILGTLTRTDEAALQRLRLELEAASRTVAALEAELDDAEERMQLDSRLLAVSTDMTRWAQQLALEHGDRVRLDLNRLTVVTETTQGPMPLWRIGSAENWIGAHLVTHLALHRYFVLHERPVPRVIMFDQPTQAYYPSEVEQEEGIPHRDSDREAVRRMFRLLHDVAAELTPDLQIIVCDHANLPETWFGESVAHNWRNGEALIPASWLRNSALP